MDELVRWLGEQLDEDERIAKAATPGPWWHNPGKQWLGPEAFEKYDLRQGEEFVGYGGPHPFTGAVAATGPASDPQGMRDAAFIAEWDPARVLAEVAAKRDLLVFAKGIHDHHDTFTTGVYTRLEKTLRLFALAYKDRPGYRDEWRP